MNQRRHSSTVRTVALATLLPFLLSSCGGKSVGTGGQASSRGSASPLSDRVLRQIDELPDALELRLSEGASSRPAYDRAKLAPAAQLAPAVIAAPVPPAPSKVPPPPAASIAASSSSGVTRRSMIPRT